MRTPCQVLVTGASGFVGSALCESLVGEGFSVKAAVRRMPANPIAGEVISVDLCDQESMTSHLAGVDCVVHLAGRAHVLNDQVQNPLELFRVANVETSLALARSAIAAGVKRFVFVSSIGVNGATTSAEAFNENSAVSPVAAYAHSKLEAEVALQALVQGTTMELVVVRPPLVYAASAPGNFARLLSLVEKNIPLPFARLGNRRTMISLGNLVDFLTLTIAHEKASNQLFLISDCQSVSTGQIVEALSVGMGQKARLFYMPGLLMKFALTLAGKKGIYTQLFSSLEVDSRKAQNLLGWIPREKPVEALIEAGKSYKQRRP